MTSEKKTFLLAQLQEAIDEAVTESGRISDVIEEMKRCGYDLCLMLESTVTLSPTDDQHDAVPEPRLTCHTPTYRRDVELTDADREFLQELSIVA